MHAVERDALHVRHQRPSTQAGQSGIPVEFKAEQILFPPNDHTSRSMPKFISPSLPSRYSSP